MDLPREDVPLVRREPPVDKASWEHIKDGFWGDYLPLEAAEAPFHEWEELIGLFARSVIAAKGKLGV